MARGSSLLEGGIPDDVDAWMDRRKAQVGQFMRDAEVAGRQAWNDATRNGQNVLARTQSELATLGAQRLGQTKPISDSWLDRSSAAKTAGGSIAQMAGSVAGLGRGAWHSMKGLGEGALFATRLLDPDDAEENGADNSAWGQVFNAGKEAFDYAKKGFANPSGVASDLHDMGRQFALDTVPSATPVADTFGGEMARKFNLGANLGEIGWDLGSLAFGGAASKALRGLGSTADAGGAAKFLAQGFSPAQADYLAAPYEGMGHHFFPRNAWKPIRLPQSISDSPFNVLSPTGMNRGDFYELHYAVDPRFKGTGLGAAAGGGGWSGKRLGLPQYGPLGQIWHGSPAPLNAAVGVQGMAGLATFSPSGDDQQ